MLAAACVVLDVLYIPVTRRAVAWFNEDTEDALAGTTLASLQCHLRLVPYTACDAGMVAFSSLTFLVTAVLYPLVCSWALIYEPGAGIGADLRAALSYHVAPIKNSWWRALWAGPVAHCRKLVFPLIVGGWRYPNNVDALALLVFLLLLGLLLAQVRTHACVRARLVYRQRL